MAATRRVVTKAVQACHDRMQVKDLIDDETMR